MSDVQTLLRLEAVVKSFPCPSPGGDPVPVLRGLDFELAQGESVAIVGPSGSGKSTLLNLIGTLDRPDTGRLLWQGRDLALMDEQALARFRNESIGFIFQHHHLLPQCNAIENVLLPTLASARGASRDDLLERAKNLLARVGLANRMGHRPGELSGGERQRVAVVRALMNGPDLLLADEPTGSLDATSAASLGDLLVEINREQALSLVLVTHSLELANRMQRRIELRDGQLLRNGL